MRTQSAEQIVGDTYFYPTHAWETKAQADVGRRQLLRILYYLRTDRRQRMRIVLTNRKKDRSIDSYAV